MVPAERTAYSGLRGCLAISCLVHLLLHCSEMLHQWHDIKRLIALIPERARCMTATCILENYKQSSSGVHLHVVAGPLHQSSDTLLSVQDRRVSTLCIAHTKLLGAVRAYS